MKIFNSRKAKIHRHVILATLAIVSIITSPRAPQPVSATQQSPEDRVALYQALLDLQNPWTVMCVAAHPDDEDGTSLIVMRRKYGAHTVSLFSTFGEGGQNAIGPELYEELGAIRARETMAAAEIQGSEPHFLGLKDFGYSKSFEETFQKWGHDEALRRMVLEIRKLRPDVIITNHSVTTNDHGHHQATARLVVEAFDTAADPNKFPEQLKDGVTTWQVQRLFVRARGNQAQSADVQIVTIDPNEKDPVRGGVYAEEALRALQKHATQGPWPRTFAEYANRFRAFSGQPGGTPGQLPMIRYALVRSANGAAPLSAKESHNFLDGLRLPPDVASQMLFPTINGRPLTEFADNRQQVLEALLTAKKSSNAATADRRNHSLRVDRNQLLIDQALGIAAGLNISISPHNPILVPGGSNTFSTTITNNGSLSPWVIATYADAGDTTVERFGETVDKRPHQIPPGKSETLTLKYSAPRNAAVTLPNSEHLYDGHLFRQLAMMTVSMKLDSVSFSLTTKTGFDISPPVEINVFDSTPYMLKGSVGTKQPTLNLQVTNHLATPFIGKLNITNCDGNHEGVNLGNQSVSLKAGASIKVRIPLKDAATSFPIRAMTRADDTTKQPWEPEGRSKCFVISRTEAQVAPSLHVGYIRGFDFSLPNALNALGVESQELSIDDVKSADLSKFTSVIVDNRVYESQPELIGVNQKLLDYANAGGNLIVFYHKSDEWNPDPRRNRPQLGPYKLILGNERITDENAPVTFLEPDHPLLNVPNKLNQDDFKDWIQERGLYYPREWDPQFHALVQSNDPGEAPLKGGLLVADYGRGHYIYSSMVWYRQLRAGAPGAYRMLANMISYGRTK